MVSRSGSEVFVSEGFALPLARRLRESLLQAQSTGPVLSASTGDAGMGRAAPAGEPALALAGLCRSLVSGNVIARDMLTGGRMRAAATDERKREQQIW